MSARPEWIAVDWGTSNLRVWGMSAAGEVTASASSDKGMGRLEPADFPSILTRLIADHIVAPSEPLDVVICGMAGARQGWMEAAYMQVPASLEELGLHAVHPEMPETALRPVILPGLCQQTPGDEDVMRGEETQLLGLARLDPGHTGLVCMPGTHSKWAYLDGTSVTRFSTAMTGELFEVLRLHSVLRHSLTGAEGAFDPDGFDAGLGQALDDPSLVTSLLFKVRAAALVSDRTPAWCAGYLSGLLIGSEIAGHRDALAGATVPVIGNNALANLYATGLEAVGARTKGVDATSATLTGLGTARLQMKG